MLRVAAFAFCAAVFSGCAERASGVADEVADGDAAPPEPWLDCVASPDLVHVAFGGEADAALTVLRHDGLGPPVEVEVDAWTVHESPGGHLTHDGDFRAAGQRGGLVWAEAWVDGQSVDCRFDVFLEHWHDPAGIWPCASEAVTGCGPPMIYPPDGAVIPEELPPPPLHAAGSGRTVFEIEAAYARVRAVVDAPAWQPDWPLWAAVLGSAADQPVRIRAVDGDLAAGPWIELHPGRFGMQGTLVYWSPETFGLWRLRPGAAEAEPWLGGDAFGDCVGCHAVNLANPERMTMALGDGNGENVVRDLVDDVDVLRGADRPGNFSTLDPTGTRLLRSVGGELLLDDVETGALLAIIGSGGWATHPSWAPDGDQIVYSRCADAPNPLDDVYVEECGLASRTVEGDGFGPEEVLVPAEPGWNHYYPAFSPDSRWIAFNRSDGDAYDDDGASLHLVARGGGPTLELAGANGPGSTKNSWPQWGPVIEEHAWLAFASDRAFGPQPAGTTQIWLSALDLSRAEQQQDPSTPAQHVPGQNPLTGNHTPVWLPRTVPAP